MGIGSAVAQPYGNGGQMVNDMIGPAYATVKLVADSLPELLLIATDLVDLIAAGAAITANLEAIEGAVEAGESAQLSAAAAAASAVTAGGFVATIQASATAAANSAAAAAASALLASNIAGANFVAKTGDTINGNLIVTGFLTVGDEAYGVGWNGSFQAPTKNAVYDKIKAIEDLKGVANGFIMSDGDNKVAIANLPDAVVGALKFQATWNANTNTPAIPAAGLANKGHYYLVSVAGATAIGGINDWSIGDWLVSDGTTWNKIDNSDKVSSVNGQSGVVVLAKADVGLGNVDNTSDALKPLSNAAVTALAAKAPLVPREQTPATNNIVPTFTDDVVSRNIDGVANIANPTGVAIDFHGIVIRLTSAGAYAITWGNKFRVIGGVELPLVTVAGKTIYVGALYNEGADKWDVLYVGVEQ